MATFPRRRFLQGSLAALATAAGCGRRKGTGFAGYAFVANEESRSVAAVDLTAFAVRRHIALDASPTAIVAHPQQAYVYALAPAAGTVYEIDAAALKIRRKVRAGGPLVSMRMAPGADALWLLCREPKSLIRLGLDAFREAARIRLPAAAGDFDLSSDGRWGALSFSGDRAVALANLAATKLDRIGLPSEPRIVRFQSDGRQLLVGHRGDRSLSVVDVPARKVVVQLPLPLEPVHFCFKPDGGQLFVTGPGMDAVAVIYPYNTEVSETVLAGKSPGAMAVSSSPEYLFVANPASGDVTVLNIYTRKVLAAVAVGEEPHEVVITPDNQYALVLNRKSGDLAVIRIAVFAELSARRTKIAPLFTMIPVGAKPVSAAVRGA